MTPERKREALVMRNKDYYNGDNYATEERIEKAALRIAKHILLKHYHDDYEIAIIR